MQKNIYKLKKRIIGIITAAVMIFTMIPLQTITAYAETKEQSRLIDTYMESSNVKFKRMVENHRTK